MDMDGGAAGWRNQGNAGKGRAAERQKIGRAVSVQVLISSRVMDESCRGYNAAFPPQSKPYPLLFFS